MKVAKLAIGVVLIGGLTAGAAWAQSSPGQQLPAQPADYGYAEVQGPAAMSPSDAYRGAPVAPACYACSGASYGACPTCGGFGEPFRIFGNHPSGFDVGGWISVGGHANEYGSPRNGPLGFNDIGDGINVHQLWGYLGKETDTGGVGWDWGGRVDYLFGVDAPDTQAFGGTQWDVTWDTGRDYGSAIPQAYGEVAMNYLTVKAGYFFSPIGYEVVQAPKNFFYSHSYTHYYLEPFTHTGALATYEGFENWTFHGGWTTGWDTAWERIGDSNTYLGGATYRLGEDLAVTYMASAGRLDLLPNERRRALAGRGDVYMHSIVMELGLTDRLDWIIQSDLHYRDGEQRVVRAGGVNQYLLWALNDCWAFGMRFEWLHDRDAAFVLPNQAAGNFYNLTAGVNWRPHANFIFRPELRYDWYSGNNVPGGLPFNDGQDSRQLSGGFDVIVQF